MSLWADGEGGVEGVRRGGSLVVFVSRWRLKSWGGKWYGRKLQAVEGRWDTRVNISVMSRCWTDVSYSDALADI